jgi:hypothetical protein
LISGTTDSGPLLQVNDKPAHRLPVRAYPETQPMSQAIITFTPFLLTLGVLLLVDRISE